MKILKNILKNNWRKIKRMIINPEVKIGDKIILIKSNNGYDHRWPDTLLKVIMIHNNNRYGNRNYFTCKSMDNTIFGNICIYQNGPKDDYIIADRKAQSEFLLKMIDNKKKSIIEYKKNIDVEIKKLEEENKRITEYESDEHYTASKIKELMESKDVNNMAEILKTLKTSNYL